MYGNPNVIQNPVKRYLITIDIRLLFKTSLSPVIIKSDVPKPAINLVILIASVLSVENEHVSSSRINPAEAPAENDDILK
jgi:hypothetical protein